MPAYEYELHETAGIPSPAVQALSGEDFEGSPGASSVADILQLDSTVTILSDARGERALLYHGFDGRAVGVEVEGIPLLVPYDGQGRLAELPAAWIGSVSIAPDAAIGDPVMPNLGGTLAISLLPPGQGPRFELAGEYGLLRQGRLRAGHAYRTGDLAWVIEGGGGYRDAWSLSDRFEATPTEDGGLRLNSDRRDEDLLLRLRWAPSETLELTALAGAVDGAWGVPPSTTDEDPRRWRFTAWQSGLGAVRVDYRVSPRWSWRSQAWATGYHNILDAFDDLSYSTQDTGGAFHSTHGDLAVGAWTQLDLSAVETALGPLDGNVRLHVQHLNHRQQPDTDSPEASVAASVVNASSRWVVDLGDRVRTLLVLGIGAQIPRGQGGEDDNRNAGELGSLADTLLACQSDVRAGSWVRAQSNAQGRIQTGVLNSSGLRGPVKAQASAAYDELDTDVDWSASIAVQVFPASNFVIEVAGSRTYRFPTLKERFSVIEGTYLASPDLRLEQSWSIRASARWSVTPDFTLRFSGYDSEVVDLIEVTAAGQGVQQLQNIGRARLAGAELGLDFDLFDSLVAGLGYNYLLARRLDSSASSETLPNRPEHQLSTRLAYRPLSWLEIGARGKAVSSMVTIDAFHTRDVRLGSCFYLDAWMKLSPYEWLDIWLSATNAFDALYYTDYGFPEPGRQIFIGSTGRML